MTRIAIVTAVILSLIAAPAGTAHRAPDDKPPRRLVKRDFIPYGQKRRHQMARYSKRHYGRAVWRLRNPKVIVLHFTGGSSYQSAWNTFASNAPNRGELPGVCSHFVVGKQGTAHQLVSVSIRCRHAIGLNYTSLGVEMVQETGRGAHWADRQILHRRKQIRSTLRLVAYLRDYFHIRPKNIIGHSMANNSPFFKDNEGWTNTHTDWLWRDVKEFRRRLRKTPSSA
jgi:hypothetical protein